MKIDTNKMDVEIDSKKIGIDDLGGGVIGIASLGLDHLRIKYYDIKKHRYVELDVGRWLRVKYQ